MLCENCHKKQAIMHMVCLVGDKQIDKWLCGDCAKDYLPMGMGDMPLTPEGAKRFLDEMLKGAGRKPKKKVSPNRSKAFLISEHSGHMFPTKSFDSWQRRQEQAQRHMRVLNDAMADGEHAGCFGWCMFDYPTHRVTKLPFL